MKTVMDTVNDARTAAERAKAKLMLSRTGTAGVIESPEVEVDQVLVLLASIEEQVQKAAANALAKGAAVAAALAPTTRGGGAAPVSSCCEAGACRSEAPTTKIPRMEAVVITDVIDGTFQDMRERIEAAR
ncbi:MAG: hypothetical protein U0804_28540 [Gemmataceae bacterium]